MEPVCQGFSAVALLPFEAGEFLVVGTALCRVWCLPSSLSSTHYIPAVNSKSWQPKASPDIYPRQISLLVRNYCHTSLTFHILQKNRDEKGWSEKHLEGQKKALAHMVPPPPPPHASLIGSAWPCVSGTQLSLPAQIHTAVVMTPTSWEHHSETGSISTAAMESLQERGSYKRGGKISTHLQGIQKARGK